MAEALPTVLTLVEPPCEVQPLVNAEALGPSEGLATLSAGVGLLPAVNPPMVAEVLLGPKGLATVITVERPFPGVYQLVPEEV